MNSGEELGKLIYLSIQIKEAEMELVRVYIEERT
jgi:hypothetical protein